MGVKDVRISPGLNQAVWSRGVKSPPRRIRVRLERKRNDDEGAKEKLYVVASVVEGVTNFKVGPFPMCDASLSRDGCAVLTFDRDSRPSLLMPMRSRSWSHLGIMYLR